MRANVARTTRRSSSGAMRWSKRELLWLCPLELPAERAGVLDDLRIVVTHLGVERDGAAYPVVGHHLHHAEDSDAVSVVARRPVDDVGCQAGATGHRLVQRKGLDVRDDPEGQASAVRSGDGGGGD